MARRRFFVPLVRNGQAEIAGDEARHLTQVLRVEPGQRFEISDNQSVYLAEIAALKKSQVQFNILERLPDPPLETPVHLLAALFKFDRLEWLLEKVTELGVTSVQFVEAERSDKGLEKAAEKRIERWRRIVLEASQQSRRIRMPELHAPVRLRDALRVEASHRLFLDEDPGGAPLLRSLDGPVDSVALLVGPEGGWRDEERTETHRAGWKPIWLGSHILRAETAGIAALSIVKAALQR